MTASKILAAVLALCVAQNTVYGAALYEDKPLQDINKARAVESNGYFGCMAAMVPLYNVINEFRSLYKDYNQSREKFQLLKDQCEKMTNEAAKESCMKDADEFLEKEMAKIIAKSQDFIANVYQAAIKLKECFVTEQH